MKLLYICIMMKHFSLFLTLIMVLSSCSQTPKSRLLPFESIENGRELGGLVMKDGRTVRYGTLVRSGDLSRASDADVALLVDRFNLTDVYDFRFDAEANSNPDRPIEGVRNTRLSTLPQVFVEGFMSGRTDTTAIKSANLLDMLAKYAFHPNAQKMAEKIYPAIVTDTTSQRRYGEFLRGVLEAKGGVLWHCSQGKDRAGWATAFVLGALGAGRETIVEDFDLSNEYYAAAVEAVDARILEMGGGEPELAFIHAMVGVSRENFESTLDFIEARYGSLQAYIEKALGFSAAEQEQLRDKLLEP